MLLDKLKNKANVLYQRTNDEKYQLILTMLENDNCFFELDVDKSINVLMDLGYGENECHDLYKELMKEKYYKESL